MSKEKNAHILESRISKLFFFSLIRTLQKQFKEYLWIYQSHTIINSKKKKTLATSWRNYLTADILILFWI